MEQAFIFFVLIIIYLLTSYCYTLKNMQTLTNGILTVNVKEHGQNLYPENTDELHTQSRNVHEILPETYLFLDVNVSWYAKIPMYVSFSVMDSQLKST